ncbi:MAG: helix-turn-helix transcriptional regulator [Candidatus Omnitrophica bacterium]|nr:helix-turn-helix transcriptional regulator [Candidatus Omnitrophota bacterium]
MPDFGSTLYCWRARRGVTQQALAHASRLPRPTVSALERGALDPTLRTIRRVAAGLHVPAGWLVDGRLPPGPDAWTPTRASVERVVAALVGRSVRLRPVERQVAALVTPLVPSWVARCAGPAPRPSGVRRMRVAWVLARAQLGDAALKALAVRLEKARQRRS